MSPFILSPEPPPRESWDRYTWDRVRILDVEDGDTITPLIYPAFRRPDAPPLRLLGINSAEMRGAGKAQGAKAREHMLSLLDGAGNVIVRSHRTRVGTQARTFDRYLAEVWVERNGVMVNLSLQMLEDGAADPYSGP